MERGSKEEGTVATEAEFKLRHAFVHLAGLAASLASASCSSLLEREDLVYVALLTATVGRGATWCVE
jgi:hypothetical protein